MFSLNINIHLPAAKATCISMISRMFHQPSPHVWVQSRIYFILTSSHCAHNLVLLCVLPGSLCVLPTFNPLDTQPPVFKDKSWRENMIRPNKCCPMQSCLGIKQYNIPTFVIFIYIHRYKIVAFFFVSTSRNGSKKKKIDIYRDR